MRLCCELCDNIATTTYKEWLEHLTCEIHQKCTQRNVWLWEEEANRRSLVITGKPDGRGKFQQVNIQPIAVAWHFSKYGILSNIFTHPNQKFFIIQLEQSDQAHKALTSDPCIIEGISISLRPKTELSTEDWFILSSCSSNEVVTVADSAPDDLLEAKQLWYSEQMLNLQSDMQLEKFISLATMSASDFSKRENIRSDLSCLIKREYGNAKLQGVGDVITGLGDSESTLIVHIDVLGVSRNPLQHKHDDWYSTTSFVDAIYRLIVAASNSSEKFCQDVVLSKEGSEPFISLTHYPTNVDVELHFESVIPVYSSKLIQFLISLDPRVLPLMLVLRYWTAYHVQPINSISTYTLELLVVAFLNNCKILPNVAFLQSKTTNKIPMVDNFWNVNFSADYEEITNILTHSGKTPVEYSETTRKPTASSILLLARDFFKIYATADFKNNIVCSLLGNLLPKDGFNLDNSDVTLPLLLQPYKNWALLKNTELDIKSPLCVQDPFNLGKNVASNVTDIALQKFQDACCNSIALFERLSEDATGVLPNFMDFSTRIVKKNNISRNNLSKFQTQSSHNGVLRKRPWQQSQASATVTQEIEDDDIQIVNFVSRSRTLETKMPGGSDFRKESDFESRNNTKYANSKPLLPLPEMNMPVRNSFHEAPVCENRNIANYGVPRPLLSLPEMNMPTNVREDYVFENRNTGNYSKPHPKPLLPLPEMSMTPRNNFREELVFENRHMSNYSNQIPNLEINAPYRFHEEPVLENRYINDNIREGKPLLPFPRRPNRNDPPERILRNPGDHHIHIPNQSNRHPESSRRFTPECAVIREMPSPVFRSQRYNGDSQPQSIRNNSNSPHRHNNRPPFMGEQQYQRQQEDHQFERGNRNRSVTVLEREPFQNRRLEDNSVSRGRNHMRNRSRSSRGNEKRARRDRSENDKQLEEAIPVDGVETYELRIRHQVAPSFAHCFNLLYSNMASNVEIEQKCTSLWAQFLKDYFTEIWETAFKLTAKICDPTIILDKLYANRANLAIRDSYSERELDRLHKIKDQRHDRSMTVKNTSQYEIYGDDDYEQGSYLISSFLNRPQNGNFRSPHEDKFTRLNYHEKFCISFLVGGCTEIFSAHALRHIALQETRGRTENISPLEKEGLVNQIILERMRQEKTYREFIATAKVDLRKEPPELLTIFTETPDCPGMEEVFYNMTDIMKGCLSQYQNYRFERWVQ